MPASPGPMPLGPPVISGTTITKDLFLKEPTKLTRDIAQLTMQRFFLDKLFNTGGSVSGGAVLYERPNPIATDLYSNRDFKEVLPGKEAPILTFDRGVPMIAKPRKLMGKWYVYKETFERNDTGYIRTQMTQTSNTLRRRLELLGLAEVDAVVTSTVRYMTGTSWGTFAGTAVQSRTGIVGPIADIMAAQTAVDLEERGNSLDTALLHPNQILAITQAYPDKTPQEVLAAAGITQVHISQRQTAGRVRLWKRGEFGEWRNEFPLAERTWEVDETDGTVWYQWSISPTFMVTNPYTYMELRGVA